MLAEPSDAYYSSMNSDYRAPEVGEQGYSPESDIYAWAQIAVELIKTFRQRLANKGGKLVAVVEIWTLIERCLDDDVRMRQHAGQDLEEFLIDVNEMGLSESPKINFEEPDIANSFPKIAERLLALPSFDINSVQFYSYYRLYHK